jgi:aspartyl-tRNA(Asn)/glutamyl-tRNA(Gln) amidotransferase subunit C
MIITKKEVENIAHLSRLELSEEEKEKYILQLNQILEYFQKLKELDTENVEPTFHIVPIQNIFREDSVGNSLNLEEVLKNAPEKEEDYFLVPRVIE